MRAVCEFYCHCNHFIYPKLNLELNGNHEVVCPMCKHVHYRVVKDGKITEDRHSESSGTAERLILMPSAASKTKREMGKIARFREMVAAGMAK